MLRKAFGHRLRFLRLLVNKTQARLAEEVGVTEEHLGNIERGVSVPSFQLVCRLAQELDTPPNNLFLFDDFDLCEEAGSTRDWEGLDWKQYVTRVGYWSYDIEDGSVNLSGSLFEILGHEPFPTTADVDRLAKLIHSEDLPSVFDCWDRFVKGQYPASHTFRFHRKDGTLRMGLVQGEVELDEYGEPVRYHGVFLDITEQKRFEASLLATRRKIEAQVAVRTRDMQGALARAEREAEDRSRAEEELAQELGRRLTAEQERQEREAQFEPILTAMTDSVVYFRDQSLVISWCNRAYAQKKGDNKPGEFVGRHCYEVMHGTSEPCPDCPVLKAFVSGREEELEHKDGLDHTVHIRAFPVLDDEGRVAGVVEMARDITASRRDEEMRLRFEAIVNASNEPLALLDLDGSYLAVNDALKDFQGLSGESLVGMSARDLIDESLYRRTLPMFQRAVSGETVEFEVWADSPELGRVCWACRLYPQHDEDGAVVAVAAMATNVTEPKITEERLRVQSQMVSSSPDAMAFVDRDLRHRIVNRTYCEVYGLSRKEIEGRLVADLMPRAEYENSVRPNLQRALAGETVRYSAWFDLTGSGRCCLDVTFAPCQDEDGAVIGAVVNARDVTSRVRSQEALAESEERYRGLTELLRRMADNMPDLLWAKDMNNRFLFVNQAICDKLLKCKDTTEPLGRDDLFFADRERRAGHEHTFGEVCVNSDEEVRQAGRAGRFLEDGLVRGEYLALDVHKAPFYDADRVMIGTVGAGRDVTEDQAVRKALEESNERFRLVAEHSPDIVWFTDDTGRLTYASQACERILGWTPEEMVALKPEDVFDQDSCAIVRAVMNPDDAEKTGIRHMYQSDRLDLTHLAKDGGLVQVEIVRAPVFDSRSEFRGVVGISRDVSEQRKAEAEVRESLEKYRILFDLDFDAIFLVENETTRILEANRTAEKLLGYTRDELLGMRMAELSTEPELTLQSCRTELRGAERLYRRKNGQAVPVEISSSHFIWQERRVHIAALRDVSDRKRLDQERRDVERMLRHELRTPALAAVTVANLLKEEKHYGGDALQMLNELERQGRCMLETMDLHADLHRLETGQFRPDAQQVDLADICGNAGRDIAYMAEQRSVALKLECPLTGRTLVQGDGRLIRSAVVNLIKNALEACGPGEEVRVRCRREEGRAVLTVRNPGVIPEAFRAQMFEKYTTRGKLGGQGLGCYLARRVAEAHSGEISSDCSDGWNTEVSLALPIVEG